MMCKWGAFCGRGGKEKRHAETIARQKKSRYQGWIDMLCKWPHVIDMRWCNPWRWGSGLGSGRNGAQAPALGLVHLPVCVGAGLAAVPHSLASAGRKAG